MRELRNLIILFSIYHSGLCQGINYIVNGNFGLPVLPMGVVGFSVTGWTVNLIHLYDSVSSFCPGFQAQCLDLQANLGQNGYISQVISLPNPGTCNLTFKQKAFTTSFLDYVM